MKRFFFTLLIFLFTLSAFSKDFSTIYSDFYNQNFSEYAREVFVDELRAFRTHSDVALILVDSEQAQECFYKLVEITSHPMSSRDIQDFQYYAFLFTDLCGTSHVVGEELLVGTISGFFVMLIVMIFILHYAVGKEESYRKLKNLSEISKAVEEATIKVQDSERKKLYQTLHDTISQNIKAEQIFTEKMDAFISGEEAAQKLYQSIRNIQSQNLVQIRSILNDYSTLSTRDFFQSMDELCTSLKTSTGLDIKILIQNREDFSTLSQKTQEGLYNIVKEAINNAFRHAHAESVSVIFRHDRIFTLLIIDDGCGFNPEKVDSKTHHGLEIMKNRAALLGGQFSIKSEENSGTVIKIEW